MTGMQFKATPLPRVEGTDASGDGLCVEKAEGDHCLFQSLGHTQARAKES